MYDKKFFQTMNTHVQLKPSAKNILPIVREYIQFDSVVDVGCGIGSWLKESLDVGALKILGIDGNAPEESLLIDKSMFLKAQLDQPLELTDKFDLCISLEVGEHISEEYVEVYLKNLVSLSDVILFSAAIPGQGGEGHINEQWPSYWVEKFDKFGYIAVDILRQQIWDREDIGWPYQQNIMFYVKKEVFDNTNIFKYDGELPKVMNLVHPKYWLRHALLLPNETKYSFLFKKSLKAELMIFKKFFKLC